MDEYEVIEIVSECTRNIPVVASLGNISKMFFSVDSSNESILYVLGSMGLVPSLTYGLACGSYPRKVVGVLGEGAAIMNLGSFLLFANGEINVTLIIINNKLYNTTGGQANVGGGFEWGTFIKLCGISNVFECNRIDELQSSLEKALRLEKCSVVIANVQPFEDKLGRVSRDLIEMKNTFCDILKHR